MFPPNTTLKRTEPQDSPLDELRVVAPSPVKQATIEEWAGSGGDHVIVTPLTSFGSNEVVPQNVLQELYEVVEYGEDNGPRERVIDPTVRPSRAHAESPEDIFRRRAREQEKKPSNRKPS